MNKFLNRIALTFAMVLSGGVWAAQTDISSAPLSSTTAALVKPNIMLLMDTSGSMGWSHMPDEVASGSGIETGITRIGYKAAQCNVLYYNRNLTYAVPKKPDGTPFPTPSFTNAPYAGYVSYYASPSPADSTSVNLSTSFKAYDDYTLGTSGFNDTPQPAYYYWYEGSQSLKYNTAPCTDTDNMTGTTDRMATGGGTWHRVVVSTTSGPAGRANELNNFAIWYSYYRIRISLTKSAASLAFTPLTDSFRVGFITVRPKDNAADTTINQAKYLAINDFNSSQRDLWFAKLFSQTPQGSSPAREGLARVGRHYAGKTDGINTGMTGDPMQFSCQQNFTIMTTDGYWNSQEETPGGGPVGLDGVTPVGQLDGTLTDDAGLVPRPIWDGSVTSTATQVDASNMYYDAVCSGTAQLQTTFKQLSSTKQYTTSTVQTSQTTDQYVTRTRQFLQSTDQYTTSTVQTSKTTQQYVSSTIQYRQSTQQYQAYTTQTSKRTQQYTVSTRQNLQSTERYTKSTSQTSKTTTQYTLATNQPLKTTYQLSQSVSQFTQGTAQVSRRDYRNIAFDARTELRTPVASCTPSTYISCEILEVMPTSPAASCTPGQGGAPNYTITVCSNTGTPTVPVASCTPGTTTSGAPNYTTTTCTKTVTTPAAYVASCTQGTTTGSAPNYYVTTCTKMPLTTDVPVSSCSAGTTASPNYVITTCGANTTPATGVQSCTVGSTTDANFVTSTCVLTNPTVFVPSTPACANQTASSSNSWVGISCNTATTPETNFNGTCTAGTTNNASYLYTTCKKYVLTTNTPILATCVAGRGPAPDYVTTTCPAAVVTGPTATASCTPGTTVSGTYVQTTCTYNDNSGFVANQAACPANIAPTSANGYTTTTCNTVTTPTTVVPSCTVGTTTTGSPNYINTICTLTNLTTNTPVAACTPGVGPAPGYVVTTCPAPVVTAPVGVLTCVPGTTQIATPPYTVTTCAYNNNTVFVPDSSAASCTNQTAASSNQYTTVSCNTVTTPAVAGPQCTPGTTTSGSPAYLRTTCTKNVVTSNVPVASCTAGAGGAPNYIVTTCPTPITSTWQGVASCTPGNTVGVAPLYVGSQCVHNNTTAYVPNVASCTPQTAGASNSYVGITCNTVSTPATNVASCTPGTTSDANFLNTTCTEVPGAGPTPVATCTPGTGPGPAFVTTSCTTVPLTSNVPVASCTPSVGPAPDYVNTTCSTGPAPGHKRLFQTTYTTTKTNYSGGIVIGTPVVTPHSPADPAPQETDNICYIDGVSSPPALPVPNPARPGPAQLPAPLAGCSAWPCTTTATVAGGSTNSLADVAQYYYMTDLRPGPAWPNTGVGKVPAVGSGPEDDRDSWQHMTTFTIALGVSGTLNYQSDYRSSAATTGDFADIRAGRNGKAWPVWPDPTLNYSDFRLWENPKSIDDFWHTAVNGRGQYFSAGDPTSVVAGLKGALAGIQGRLASATGVGSSTQQPVIGDNAAFVATFVTQDWYGDVQSRPINLATGALETTVTWSAQAKLDAATGNLCDNRQIKLMRAGALVDFTMNTKTCDSAGLPSGAGMTALNTAEQAYFNAAVVQQLSQWLAMTDGTFSTVDQVTPSAGANLVNFIRGQRGFEGFETGVANKLYRARKHVLGDVATSQPLYVKQPFAAYADAGYDAFKTAQAGRKPMVYAGANDGMLHAFYAGSSASDPDAGKEAWAVIPSAVLPNLFKLADDNYKNIHQFFVDGSPIAGDAFDANSNQWKTVLVGGLNAGGKSYYAMDVTNPDSPQGLWEFKWSDTCYDGSAATAGADCHLGYTFGKPIITKLADGTWVVLLTSGYNNVNAPSKTGDGVGYLYVLNAFTGKVIYKISTNAGTAGTPSGLAQINNYVDNAVVNNTTLKVYGGDVLGNIWRFDVNDTIAPSGREATKIGVAETAGHVAQPITTRPELAELNGKPMVFVGTGRLLGATDVGDATGQSVYGIVDPSTGDPVYADLRASLKPMALTQVGSGTTATRTVACTGTTAQCGSTNGWVVDLPASGERVNIDMKLVLGTLVFASNVPDNSACTTGGYSWLNYLDFATGTAVIGGADGSVGVFRDGSLAVGLGVWRLPTGGGSGTDPGKFVGTVSGSDGSTTTTPVPVKSPVPDGKRISWREIAQ